MTTFDQLLEVLRICLPVFGLMGFGRILKVRGFMSPDNQDFLARITYHFALPSLIFVELVVQPFEKLFHPALIFGSLAATAVMITTYSIAGRIAGLREGNGAAFTFGSFWANVSYIGFPLAASAFGQQKGIAMAAVFNAFAMPFFIMAGFTLIALGGGGSQGRRATLKTAIVNPVMLAAVLGIVGAGISSLVRSHVEEPPIVLVQVLEAARAFFRLIGSMGLPLALIAVGAAVDFGAIKGRLVAVGATVTGKLLLAPLITLIIIKRFFPATEHEALGVAVLLMATPSAVASYVVAKQLHTGEDFTASTLVISTSLSVITIPVWLFFLL